MTRAKFLEMEFVAKRFHRPKNRRRWTPKWKSQSNEPVSNIAPHPNSHVFPQLLYCARTYLRWGEWLKCDEMARKSCEIILLFTIPVKLSESIMYFSANFLLTPSTFVMSYTWIVAACSFAGAFRMRVDFWEKKNENNDFVVVNWIWWRRNVSNRLKTMYKH